MFTSSRLSAEEVTPAAAPLRRSSERHRRRVGEQRLRLTAELYSRSQPLQRSDATRRVALLLFL